MKRVLTRAAKLFNHQSQWNPVNIRHHPCKGIQQNNSIYSCEITDDAIINKSQRASLCGSLSSCNGTELFLVSKNVINLEDQKTESRGEEFNKGISEVWTAIIRQATDLCQIKPRRLCRHSPLSLYDKRNYVQEIDSKKAVYFLFFLSSASSLIDVSLLEQSMCLLLSSITQNTELTTEEIITTVKSVNIIIRKIRDLTNDSLISYSSFDNQLTSTVSVKTIVNGIIRRLANSVPSNVPIEQAVQLGLELSLLNIYIPRLYDRIRDHIMGSGICATDIQTILNVIELWKLQGVRDRDMGVYHAVAAEMMNNRIELQATPRQIAEFLYLYGTAKIVFPYVFDRCISFLLRMTESEKETLDWITNRMHGRQIGSNGAWHAEEIPKSADDRPLDFQIGDWDSRVFAGSRYQETCRDDAELCEWDFWNSFLSEQFSMKSEDTLERYPEATLSSIVYPLFAMKQFEKQESIKRSTCQHPIDQQLSFSKVISQILEGFNSVVYYDELLIKPISQLIAMSSIHPNKVNKHKATKLYDYHLRRIGESLMNDWDIDDLLTVFVAMANSKTWLPKQSITTITKKLFSNIHLFNSQKLNLLLESIAQCSRGVASEYFMESSDVKMTLVSIPDTMIWSMSAHGLSCWLINMSNYGVPSIIDQSTNNHDSSSPVVYGWTTSRSFQTCIEALAQKLFIYYQMLGGSNIELITHRLVDEFSWAGDILITEENRDLINNSIQQISSNINDVTKNSIKYQTLNEITNNLHLNSSFKEDCLDLLRFDIQNYDQNGIGFHDNYDLNINETPGELIAHSNINQNREWSHSMAEKIFRTAWTALLSYGLLNDVWETTDSIKVLGWENSLRAKLESLPLITVSLIHDILTMCEAVDPENQKKQGEIDSAIMTSEELDRNPELRSEILKHLFEYGYEGVEPHHLSHPLIMDAVNANIKQNKLPPIPDDLKDASQKWRHTVENAKHLTNKFNEAVREENSEEPEEDNDRYGKLRTSNFEKVAYRGLGLINRRLHRFMGCRQANQMANNSVPLGFIDAVSIKKNTFVGPLKVDLTVQKIRKRE